MRKLTLSLSAAALVLGAGAVAYAQAPERGARGQDMTRTQAETMATKAFERADANGDGKIDAADREARRDARFARLDTNSDGTLSKEEFFTQHQRGGERAEGMRSGKRGERMGRRGMRGMGHGMGMARNADADGDGAITEAEFTAAMLARFDAADADNDGTVTRAERSEARKSMRERMRAQRQSGNS